MSMQIPDYSVFAQMPVSARQQSLDMIKRFAGKHAATLYLQVYQFDPDAGLREFARRELAAQGITPPIESTPIAPPSSDASNASFGGSSFSFAQVTSDRASAPLTTAIDGGTGRPVQRGPQLQNVFTLYRPNQKYLTGERSHLAHNPFVYLLLTGIFVFVFGILFVSFRGFGSMVENTTGFSLDVILWFIGGIFALILLIAYGVWFYNIRRNRRYERDAQLYLGKILTANGRWVTSTDSEGGTSRSYRVNIAYRVKLQDGREFESNATHTRGDLANGGLPMPESPIAVMVIDSDNMRVL